MEPASAYHPLTPKLMLQLAAPHTWPAALMPTLIAGALAIHQQGALSVSLFLVVLLIVLLMQSAVNALNDYFDFKKGADTSENQMDRDDAVLVFHHVDPQTVKIFVVALIACAFILGAYVVYRAGIIPLILGLVGACVLYLYSGGRLPISYLPIGEFISGFTMGTLIMMATYQTLTLELSPLIILESVPVLIGIGLILMTNNTCDIEKDRKVKRKTLPVVLGRERARRTYRAAFYVMVIMICLFALVLFTPGAIMIPVFVLALYPFGKALCANPLILESRVAAMTQILSVNVICGAFYTVIVLCASSCTLVL